MNQAPEEYDDLAIERAPLVALAVAVEGGMVLLGAGLAWLSGNRFWETMSGGAWAWTLGILLTLPMLAVALIEVRYPWGPLKQLAEDFERLIAMFRNCTVSDLLLMSILAGIGEEALFRGFLQAWCAEFMGVGPALILASAIFAMFHAISVAYIGYTFLVGLYLGGIYIWTGNLLVPMVIHGLYDFIALYYGVRHHNAALKGE